MERELRISYSSLLLFSIPAILCTALLYRAIVHQPTEDPINKLSNLESPLQFFNKGNTLFKQGKYQEAQQCFERVLQKQRGHSSAQFNLGLTLEKQHKWQESIYCFETLLQKQPDNFAFRLHYAQGLEYSHHSDQAIKEYEYILAKHMKHLKPPLIEKIKKHLAQLAPTK